MWQTSRTAGTGGSANRWLATDGEFNLRDIWRYALFPVRLATVVSGLHPCHSERSEESLFLPAAGSRDGITMAAENSWVRYQSATYGARSGWVHWIYANSGLLNLNQEWVYTRQAPAVRLATVVSDSTGMIVLFLPAAGYRDGGAGVWSAGTAGFYLAPRRYQNSNAWVIRFGESGIELPVGWIKYFMGTTVRLATVVSGLAGVSFCSCLLRAGFRKTIGFIRVITVITIVVMQIQMCVHLCAL